ncbi:fimbria/pilus periplasmic chaperone [Pantoea sp. SM3]|uniref:fimbria/pilus periplasmic chaperone n=1 Tax=Pantoea sp. SM3 TaxID=1628192 RepID=UPI0005F8617D|nr:fimbria/pilus periplasmic chaperone [Pantoea sp. SM3]KJV32933.1 hypothetical protein VI01_07075 [Pantoea sp. SM3]
MYLRNIFGALLLSTMSATATASVTLLGSRIIYPAPASSINIQFKNDDNIPYVIQTWFDDGDMDAEPQQINRVPFITTPPVFRIQPKSGQVARIVLSQSEKLPQDRESVYWFNMLQIPPTSQAAADKNAMTVMLRNRVKFFYRPAAIGKPGNILNGIKVRTLSDPHRGSGLQIDNAQPWHASFVAISIRMMGKNVECEPVMVAPFSTHTCWFSHTKQRLQGVGSVKLDAINDQGARISESYPINSQ